MKSIPRIMIAAPSSGSGKTTVVCALLTALKRRGIKTAACKCGPDYIDPMFHNKILGAPSVNLDSFFSDADTLNYLLAKNARDAEITVIEGAMGFYDGLSMSSARASSYETAVMTKTPVVLVTPARGAAYTLVSLIRGITDFRKDSNVRGVILNGVSESVYKRLKPVIEGETGVRAVGYLPKDETFTLQSRHLGLIAPSETKNINAVLERLGRTKTIDIDAVMEIAREAEPIKYKAPEFKKAAKGVRIAVAYDSAFCFYYRSNLELLESMGAEPVYFSPMRGACLPEGINGLLLGGGYPELYAEELSKNKKMMKDIKEKIDSGIPCIAECGGFMYLQDFLDIEGKSFPMAGVIPSETRRGGGMKRFGYIELCADEDTPILKKGETVKAHEFHYWDSSDNGCACTARKPSGEREWKCVHSYKNLFAGYPHMYFYSNPHTAQNFISLCEKNG